MVAAVLKLRYRALGNTLARRPWQLVGFILGSLWGLGLLAGLIVGLVALSIFEGIEVATPVIIVAGSLLLLGWTIGPVIVAGMDGTVDARRLAPYPLTRSQTMLALTGVGATGIPGMVTALAALATTIVWLRWPLAAVVAVPTVLLGVLTCVLASRLVSELSNGLGGNRRGRELIGTAVLIVLFMTGPILAGIGGFIDESGSDFVSRILQAADVLSWTPIGAAWAVAPAVAAGAWGLALVRLAIAVATIAVLWLVWSRVLDAAVSASPHRTARTVKAGKLGLFGVMPTGGVGATWARSLTAWTRDPRYLRQLIFVPLFPVLFLLVGGGVDGFAFSASPLLAALVLSIAGYTDISYDGTAFGTTLATGVTGKADRLGRVLGAACIGVPLIVAVSVATTLLSGNADRLPAMLGASLGLVLAGYATCAVSSALIVVPVAAPGDSPFKSVPGQTAVGGLLVFVVMGASIVLALPALVLMAIAVGTGDVAWGWASLAAGLVVGVGAVAAGVVLGGRTLDRNGPDLLVRIKAFPT